MKLIDTITGLIGRKDLECPDEADVLAFSENTLSTRRRNDLERHFSQCMDCQETLAFLGRDTITHVAVTEQEITLQADRILSYINKDERNRERLSKKASSAGGFFIAYPILASVGLIICAMAAAVVFVMTREQAPSEAAMASLKQAVRDVRLSEARISGGFDYSRSAGTTRGGDNNDNDFYLTRAENKVKAAADQESKGTENRIVLGRVYLARGTPEGAAQALTIYNQLGNLATENPEVLNDIGVAHLQQRDYAEATEYFKRALAKNPSYSEALFNLALAEEFDNRTEDARRDWQKFIDQSLDDRWKAEARNRLNSLGSGRAN
jgi:tetratricopeptide (TPR) repeat protein